ncbi:MAG: hypothetical protein HFJ48_01200 [Clostridia bacterium]|nr:hypothetical protein [Clostridia bacterium]
MKNVKNVKEDILRNDIIEEQVEKLFIERIEKSNMFSNNEISKIKSNVIQYEKCYLLGMCDFKF